MTDEPQIAVGDTEIPRRIVESAISLSADSIAELCRFLREGAVCNWPFGDAEPVVWLANALNHVAHIEKQALLCQPATSDYREGLGQLINTTSNFLIDHAASGADEAD